MNEITRIHLSRQPFTISVSAHKALKQYIDAIRVQVGSEPEVIEEVESRMAELLGQRGIHGDKVVVEDDITFLKSQLGEPKDFHAEDTSTRKDIPAEDAPQSEKRLFRDTQEAWVAGVAAGLGKYFGVDAIIIRILFILFTFWGGVGLFAYLLLWLLIPEAKSKSDRLQMQGKPVTVKSIKDFMERNEVEKKAKTTGGIIRKAVEVVFDVGLKLVGLLLIISAALVMFGVVTVGMYILIDPTHLIGVRGFFPITPADYASVALVAVFIGLLSVLQILLGKCIIRRKSVVKGRTVWVLCALVVATGAALVAVGTKEGFALKDRYQAQLSTTTTKLATFQDVTVQGDGRVHYIPANRFEVKIKEPKNNIHGDVQVKVVNGELQVTFPGNDQNCTNFCAGNGLWWDDVTVYAPSLRNVTVRSGAQFENSQALTQKDLSLWVQDDGSNAQISYVTANKVLAANGNMTLQGITADASQSSQYIMDGRHIDINAATDTFDFTGDCSLYGEPQVSLEETPTHMIVNGHLVSGSDVGSQSPFSDAPCMQLLR